MTATVTTVCGPIAANQLGFTLIHEHLLLDLTRDALVGNNILNDPDLALIELQRYKDAGGVTLVDQTNRGLTQDPLAIKELAARCSMQGSSVTWSCRMTCATAPTCRPTVGLATATRAP